MATACAPGIGQPVPKPPTTMMVSPSGKATSAGEISSVPTREGFTIPAPVFCGELPRDPTGQEKLWLVEAGTFSGEGFDEEAALAAVLAQKPSTHDEWVDAIIGQVQGDYAQDICDAIRFSAEIGGVSERPTASEAPVDQPERRQHFALVLDASGSMAAQSGSGTRMEAAQTAMTKFVDQLPDGASISLRIYGQEGGNSNGQKAESCASSKVVFSGLVGDPSFGEAIRGVQPVGWTPLARAISLVPEDIPADAAGAVVYVVTDGKETCDGDPVEAARQLADGGIEPIINVIGFEVGDADQSALLAIAEAGNGQYVKASSVRELNEFWVEENDRLRQAWMDWRTAESARIDARKSELSSEAAGIVASLRTSIGIDLAHAESLSVMLEEAGKMDQSEAESVGRSITWYFEDVNVYARNFEFDAKSGLFVEGWDANADIVKESFEAWRESYQEQLEDDE